MTSPHRDHDHTKPRPQQRDILSTGHGDCYPQASQTPMPSSMDGLPYSHLKNHDPSLADGYASHVMAYAQPPLGLPLPQLPQYPPGQESVGPLTYVMRRYESAGRTADHLHPPSHQSAYEEAGRFRYSYPLGHFEMPSPVSDPQDTTRPKGQSHDPHCPDASWTPHHTSHFATRDHPNPSVPAPSVEHTASCSSAAPPLGPGHVPDLNSQHRDRRPATDRTQGSDAVPLVPRLEASRHSEAPGSSDVDGRRHTETETRMGGTSPAQQSFLRRGMGEPRKRAVHKLLSTNSEQWQWNLHVSQAPQRGKAIGMAAPKRGMQPLSPPLIVQLVVYNRAGGRVISPRHPELLRRLIQTVLAVELYSEDRAHSRARMRLLTSPSSQSAPEEEHTANTLLGGTVRSSQILKVGNEKGVFFLFPDLWFVQLGDSPLG